MTTNSTEPKTKAGTKCIYCGGVLENIHYAHGSRVPRPCPKCYPDGKKKVTLPTTPATPNVA